MTPKILVMEDEAVTAMALEAMLVDHGYEVLGPCGTGEQALALAEATRPDLALLDVRVQGEMDGVTTACALRERFGVRAIFLTGQDGKDVLARAKDAQPLGYLSKPYSEFQIRAALESALNAASGGSRSGG